MQLKKPVSRLILLFILMVVVSGGILTFLSINNISNLRMITEKRIQETQLQIAGQISAQFQGKLNNLAEEFSKNVLSGSTGFDSIAPRSSPQVRLFLISKEKEFLYPFFIESGQQIAKPVTGISANFMNGEADEFQKENLQNATTHYHLALSKSRKPGDSAKVVNALGRVSVKMKQPEKAFSWYRLALDDFSKEVSAAGIPYGNLAISQLIRLNLREKQNETVALAEKFIGQLAGNEIPLTPGTQTILDELTGWFSTVQLQESQQKNVNGLVENINSKLSFISVYSNEIRELAASERKSELPSISGKYQVFALAVNGKPELLVMSEEGETPAGFVIGLSDLWSEVTSHLPEAKDFEYTVDLVSGSELLQPDELAVRTELSPYFPLHRILIKPANEELVEKFVRKRSWTYGIALALLLGGMSLGIVLILRDIKREKKMADMQSEFVAHVTHELKTPLTSINMFAETIFLDRAKSEEIRKKYANIIMKESEVLKRKIDNILEYSVRKNETTKYRIKETNLTALAGEVMDEMKYWLDINRFNVKTDIETDVFAKVDPEAIKQALTNLIGNAIKYSPVDKNLFVRLRKNAGKISFEVEDTGIGIPKDQQNLVFEKFYRVRSNENESTTGTGLGLCVTRDIVLAHGGKIFVESEINRGSKFTIQLNS